MGDISKVRFNALAAYARDPLVSLLAVELRWLEFADERVLATLILDSDGEFSGVWGSKTPITLVTCGFGQISGQSDRCE